MTGFDQGQSPRLGQRLPYEGTTVRMFSGSEIPEVSVTGQIIYRTDTQGLQVYNGSAWEDVVGGSFGLLTFVGDTPPAAQSVGDLWFDSNDGNHPYRAGATGTGSWVSLRDGTIATAQDRADDAYDLAATKATTYSGASDPAAQAVAGDLWLKPETSEGVSVNVLYRRNDTDTGWVRVDDPATQTALENAQAAADLADGKMRIFHAPAYGATLPSVIQPVVDGEPVDMAEEDDGDLWFRSDEGNKSYVYDFATTTWIPAPTGVAGLADPVTTPDSISEDLSGESVSELSITAPNIQTDPQSDQGIHLDNAGLRAYPPAGGTPFFDVKPAEGVVITTGKGTFDTVTVNTKAEFAGVTEIKSGGVVQLVSGTMPPNSAPIVGSSYAQTQFTNDGSWGSRYGWSFDGTYYHTIRRHSSGGYYPERWTTSGTLNHTGVYSGPNMTVYGCVWGGNALYVLNKQSTGTWYVDRLLADPADSTPYDGVQYFAPWNHPNTDGKTPAIGYDTAAGQLMIVQSRPTDATTPGCLRIRRYTFSTFTESLALISTVDTTTAYDYGQSGILYGTFDFSGGINYYVTGNTGAGGFKVWSTTGVDSPGRGWPSGMSAKVGMVYTGGVFKSMDDSGVLRTYTQQDMLVNQDDASEEWQRERWVYWTWYRSTGPFETTTSPKQFFTQNKRTQLTITAPTATPSSPGTNDPDGVRFYVGKSADNTSAEPARTAQWRQSTLTGSGVVHTTRLDSVATSGSVPPDPANASRTDKFPDAVPSKVVGTKKRSDSVTPVVDIPDSGAATMDGLIPPGTIMMWVGITAPPGWAICDGSELARTGTTKPLADACLISGTNYRFGNGNGTTTFNLPDLRGRFPLGAGGTVRSGVGAHETSEGSTTAPGQADGTRLNHQHTHSGPSHEHNISGQAADGSPGTFGTASGAGVRNAHYGGHSHGGQTGSAGTGQTSESGVAGANLAYHPMLTLNFIIKL